MTKQMGKKFLSNLARRLNVTFFCRKEPPSKLGIYLHNVKTDEFEGLKTMLSWILDNGYIFESAKHHVTSSGRSAFLSFDDNYYEWLDLAEMLARNGVLATFYLNTSCIPDLDGAEPWDDYYKRLKYTAYTRPLFSKEIQKIHRLGHTIGCHTHSHLRLSTLKIDDALNEILLSKKLLESIIEENVVDFSYPFGMRRDFNDTLRKLCINNGIETVANAIPGMLFREQDLASIDRTVWRLNKPLAYNCQNISTDGRIYEYFTGKAPVS